jgi:hypothetical protein
MQKKENAKVREEIEFYERVIEEKEEEDEEVDVDRIDTQSHAQNFAQQSKMSKGGQSSAFKKGSGPF